MVLLLIQITWLIKTLPLCIVMKRQSFIFTPVSCSIFLLRIVPSYPGSQTSLRSLRAIKHMLIKSYRHTSRNKMYLDNPDRFFAGNVWEPSERHDPHGDTIGDSMCHQNPPNLQIIDTEGFCWWISVQFVLLINVLDVYSFLNLNFIHLYSIH